MFNFTEMKRNEQQKSKGEKNEARERCTARLGGLVSLLLTRWLA